MGTVVQFAERLSEGGDWTPAERSQLRDMGSQLAEAAAGLDLVFGKTEEGDPWCVVADPESEVLLHIARIGGAFVVHAPANDQTVESTDLWNAVSRVVGGVLQRRRGLVLPFPPEAMGQQAVLTLMVAAAVRGDFHELIQGTLPGAPSANDFIPAVPAPTPHGAEQAQAGPGQGAPAEARPAAVMAAAASALPAVAGAAPHPNAPAAAEAAPAAKGGPLDVAAPVQQVATVQPMPWARTAPEPGRVVAARNDGGATGAGPAGSDGPPAGTTELATTGEAQGGASLGGVTQGGGGPRPDQGPDDKTGAGPNAGGGTGGAVVSHDIAVMAEGPIARGAAGSADNFVLTLPRSPPADVAGGAFASSAASGPVLLGVVENFSAAEGDRFLLPNGAAPLVTSVATLPDVTNMIPGAGVGGASVGVWITGRRFGFDLNGDGREDAFVMVLTTGEVPVLHQAASTQIGEGVAPAGQAEAGLTMTAIGIFIGH